MKQALFSLALLLAACDSATDKKPVSAPLERSQVVEATGAQTATAPAPVTPVVASSAPKAPRAICAGQMSAPGRAAPKKPLSQNVAGGESASLNWLAVIVLGVLTQFAVAVVQLDNMRPQALALFVFTTAFAATVVLFGLGERPFSGRAINDAPMRAAFASAAR